jgi:hypothetical protein
LRIEETPDAPKLVAESEMILLMMLNYPEKFWRYRHPSAVCPVVGTAANTKDPTGVK